jgi:hypothetical protein
MDKLDSKIRRVPQSVSEDESIGDDIREIAGRIHEAARQKDLIAYRAYCNDKYGSANPDSYLDANSEGEIVSVGDEESEVDYEAIARSLGAGEGVLEIARNLNKSENV